MSLYPVITQLLKDRKPFVLCTVISARGSSPRKEGAKMIVMAGGETEGSIGGGAVEKAVQQKAEKVLASGMACTAKFDLLHQLNMCCGGTMEVFLEPHYPPDRLYIFGAGNIGRAIAENAAGLSFETYVIDDRPEFLARIRSKDINRLTANPVQLLRSLPFDDRTFILVVTYDHAQDRAILSGCLLKSYAYLGMVGSLRKCEVTKKIFIESGLASREDIDRVDMPAGMDIGAVTPEEIGISILAGIIRARKLLPGNETKRNSNRGVAGNRESDQLTTPG